ncbi:hypothetical protein [Cognatazoarcus halotolerans]|uniref:hypothetical protein n=1 Tax=Cognatazoarcus halotolerans TaxID=2686016 RepID=UPI00135ABD9B|nr:hypothetical protein [Cognatazoarcus halotolerans]MCB1899562.1 hypothetical protein [Rhodocyclaceae bacterium]MCP5308381.1 hypothetical protein [Zoogloeaceae bacterium]
MKTPLAWPDLCKTLAAPLVETCTRTPVSAGDAGLVKALSTAQPDWRFRHALCRGGWYRLGGIVDGAGNRVSDNLEAWAEQALEHHDGDVGALIDAEQDRTLFATRLVGNTHYLVASSGEAGDDFLQLEIEELQEVRAHRLFDNEPGSIEEIVDPRLDADSRAAASPIGLPFYAFSRLQHVGSFLRRMRSQRTEPAPIHRMVEDWDRSSAGAASSFCNQWVLATSEHLDRFRQPVLRAQPICAQAGEPPAFRGDATANGLALADALSHFDRHCGYPMAWYFHMLTSRSVPYAVAQTVVEDALAGLAYLPERDVAVVRGWLHRPYSA